jgi:hypothetical protein
VATLIVTGTKEELEEIINEIELLITAHQDDQGYMSFVEYKLVEE